MGACRRRRQTAGMGRVTGSSLPIPRSGERRLRADGWVGGAFLISTPVPALKLLGGLAQVCGAALAFIAAPWFAIVAARWAWGQWV